MDRHTRIRLFGLAFVLLLAGLFGLSGEAMAVPSRILAPGCHAVTPVSDAVDVPEPAFTCSGKPEGYQKASLWYRFDAAPFEAHRIDDASPVFLVRYSRFDRMVVAFHYADGAVRRQHVSGGNFGAHWRVGAQIAFSPPERDAPLAFVSVRFDRPASAELLRMRVLDQHEANWQASLFASGVGAALMLLAIGGLYNIFLAIGTRRQFAAWQAGWDACMVLWGALWSQLVLVVAPGLAGAASAQACTALACGAVAFATLAAITATDRKHLPRGLRAGTIATCVLIGVLGLPLAWMRSGPLMIMAQVLGWVILLDLVLVAVALVVAWHRGSADARSYAGAWSVPLLALAATQFVDVDNLFWGGGSQIVVLFAAAWQTIWLSVASSRAHGRLRVERDLARRAEARAHDLARRDPLTGLPNRRGFIEAVEPMLAAARRGEGTIALLLIDVDSFKQVNDQFGHDAGDAVLAAIGRRIARWEGSMCSVARLGGEEFAIMVGGLDGFALDRFAESVRREIGSCRHDAAIGPRRVTVSIGYAAAVRGATFPTLYREADEALYLAKRAGRDRVERAGFQVPQVDVVVDQEALACDASVPGEPVARAATGTASS